MYHYYLGGPGISVLFYFNFFVGTVLILLCRHYLEIYIVVLHNSACRVSNGCLS